MDLPVWIIAVFYKGIDLPFWIVTGILSGYRITCLDCADFIGLYIYWFGMLPYALLCPFNLKGGNFSG
jgi:hypothetical protein